METEGCDPKSKEEISLNINAIQSLGLNPERIRLHAERIHKAIKGSINTSLPVLDACTTNNGAIISWKRMLRFTEADPTRSGRGFLDSAQKYWNTRYLITCVPAAGAASRYLASLRKFVTVTESNFESLQQLKNPAFEWSDESAVLSALPESLRRSGRARLSSQEIPNELKALVGNFRTSFPSLAKQSAILAREYERHLTCNHAVQAVTSNQREELFQATLANDEKSNESEDRFSSESIIRRHWNSLPAPIMREGTRNGLKIRRTPEQIRNLGETILNKTENLRSSPTRHIRSSTSQKSTVDGLVGGASATGNLREDQAETGEFLPQRAAESILVYSACRIILDQFESSPKAFVPATAEEDNFLFLKLVEQMSLMPCNGNIVVCPAGMISTFEEHIRDQGSRLQMEARNIFELRRTPFSPRWIEERSHDQSPKTSGSRGPWTVMEQGNNLSTIRFNQDASPFQNSDGSYSQVSAGHGELIHIFKDILTRFPEAECLHIRNIDNIIGTAPERRREIQTPARLFRIVRDCLETIRAYVDALAVYNFESQAIPSQQLLARACEDAFGALETLSGLTERDFNLDSLDWNTEKCLTTNPDNKTTFHFERQIDTAVNILSAIFHWNWPTDRLDLDAKVRFLQSCLRKPLSIFGVVRKETDDVGGGPVFSRLSSGETIKLCMEMPHASDEDKQIYFGSRGRATHFNPVLVFFELQTHKLTDHNGQSSRVAGRPIDFDGLYDDRFWIMAAKEHQGQKVCYHETVLYELIGNSATANLLFVEVPRTLFNPHKAITDGLGQDRRSHGFDETLKTQDERGNSGKSHPL